MTDPVRSFIEAELALVEKAATTPTTTLYGVDLACVTDIDSRASETADASLESLAQDIFHRVTTRRGAVPDAADFGEDLMAYLSGSSSLTDLRSIEGRLALEIQKDDRVSSVEVTLALQSASALLCTIRVTPEDPTLTSFSLIMPVKDGVATLEAILKEQG